MLNQKFVIDKLIEIRILDMYGNVISVHPGKEPMPYDGANDDKEDGFTEEEE